LIWIFYKLYEGCPCEGVAFIVFSYGCCNAVIWSTFFCIVLIETTWN